MDTESVDKLIQIVDDLSDSRDRDTTELKGFTALDMINRLEKILLERDYCLKSVRYPWVNFGNATPGRF